jgi:hypothetical protein
MTPRTQKITRARLALLSAARHGHGMVDGQVSPFTMIWPTRRSPGRLAGTHWAAFHRLNRTSTVPGLSATAPRILSHLGIIAARSLS